MNPLHPALAGLLGYLLGSISFALLLAKQRGVDLRGFGSGNLGATNATRALGRGRGLLVYFLDALKGGGPTWFVLHMGAEGTLAWEAATCAAAGAWLGHVFPLYHGFKGGKGVATLSGGFLVLDPVAVGVGALCLFITGFWTRYMFCASIGFAIGIATSVPILDVGARWGGDRFCVFLYGAAAAVLTFWTHRSNFHRLRQGTESRLGDSDS